MRKKDNSIGWQGKGDDRKEHYYSNILMNAWVDFMFFALYLYAYGAHTHTHTAFVTSCVCVFG